MNHQKTNNRSEAYPEMKKHERFLRRADLRKEIGRLPGLHEEAFSKIDCLDCAACCKQYSPRFKTPDIRRISKHLQMKEGDFIERFLRLDNEGDYVVKNSPCPFLGEDNRCSIYDHRPSDCSRFPYTDEDVLLKRAKLTLKNASFCPAVFHVLEKLSETSGH
jgi:Fe-S-cluster containining protein